MDSNSPQPRTPRRNQLPVIQRLVAVYKLWHEFAKHIPKTSRYTIGGRIDALFLACIQYVFAAACAPVEGKIAELKRAALALDMLKFFLQIAWEFGLMDVRRYLEFSEKLDEIGRMLGGWKKGLEKKLSPENR